MKQKISAKMFVLIMAVALLLCGVPNSVLSVFAKSVDSNIDTASSTSSNQCYVLAYSVDKVIDGAAPFDADDAAGNDSSDSNGIVRSFDIINYTLKYTTALKDAESMGIDSTNVMVDFELPCDVKTATFNVDTMTWLLDKKLVYVYSDGTKSETYDVRKSVVNQILTGRRLLVNNESGNTVPGTGTLAIGVNVNAAVTGDVIHPTFTIWMEGNSDSEKKTLDVATKVSAAPKFDIEIKRNGNANLLGYYNPIANTATADYEKDGDLYGRLQYYTVSLRLVNDSAAKAMKGVEFPSGDDITFDLRLSEVLNNQDVSYDADYQPILWDYAPDNGSKAKGTLGRPMSPLGQDIASYGQWTTNTPWNNGNYNGACYNGGNMIINTDANDANLLHCTFSGYQLDMKDFDFPDRWASNSSASIGANCGYISVGGIQILGHFKRSVTTTENIGITVEASNMKATSMSGIHVTDEVMANNNMSSCQVTNFPAGSVSKRNFYDLENGSMARPTHWTSGDSYAYLGEKIRIDGSMIYSGDGYLNATNILQKFDDKTFQVPAGTTSYLTYGRSNGLTQIGKINTLFAAKPDKTGWSSDTEMNNTREEQLIYFKSIDDLNNAGYTCVAILYEVRDSKLYPNNAGGCFSIQSLFEMRKDAEVGHVAMTKNDVRVWRNSMPFSWTDMTYNSQNKSYGLGDWSDTNDTYVDNYTNPTWRIYTNYGKAVYKDGTMVAGHTNSYIGGNSILIIGNKANVGIKVADMTGDKSKSVYDLDAGERTAKFTVSPSTVITTANAEIQSSDAKDDLTVKVVLPKGLHYNQNGVTLTPESVEVNKDETTTIIWKISNVKVGAKIDPITFTTTIGEEGTQNDVNHNDTFKITAQVTSKNDLRRIMISNGNLSETSISVIKLAASAVTKQTLTPLIDLNGEITYRLRYSNLSDANAKNAKLADLLPYDSDKRGSKFSGTYDVSSIRLDFSNAKRTYNYGVNDMNIFTSSNDVYKTKADLETMLSSGTSFDSFTKLSNKRVDNSKYNVSYSNLNLSGITTLGFYLSEVYGHEYIDVYITLKSKNSSTKQQPGDLYANNFVQYADNQASVVTSNVVKTQVVKRKLSGLAWIDLDGNGIRGDSETLLRDVGVTLYSTAKSSDDKSNTSYAVNNAKLYPAYDVFGNKVSTVKTDSDGKYSFDNLPAGTYYIGVSNVTKYHLTSKDSGDDDALDSDAELFDDKIFIKEIVLPDLEHMSDFLYENAHNDVGFIEDTKIHVKKFDMSDKTMIAGAKLAVYDVSDMVDNKPASDAKPVLKWTSEADKAYAITNTLLAGHTYVLFEESAPTGYAIANPIKFTVESGKDSQTVVMHDDYISYDVDVQKINKKGVKLAGAKLQVTGTETGSGSEITPIVWTSSKDKAETVSLKPGKYVLSELEPPAGYDVTKDVSFEVHTDGNVYVNGAKVDVVNMIDAEMRPSTITLSKYNTDGKTALSGVTYELKFVKSAVDSSTDYHRLLKEGETTTAVTDTNGQIVFKNLQQGTYEITEIKTRDGLQLLNEPIKVTLPIAMTEEDVKRLQADTSKGVYDDENHVWQFYDATYRITNDVTFGVPQAGAMMTVKHFVPILLGMSVFMILCMILFRRKRDN